MPPKFNGRPFMDIDGTDVEVCSDAGEKFLFVDHRRDRNGPARIEFWECLGSPEGHLAGLYALTDAAGRGRDTTPVKRLDAD